MNRKMVRIICCLPPANDDWYKHQSEEVWRMIFEACTYNCFDYETN